MIRFFTYSLSSVFFLLGVFQGVRSTPAQVIESTLFPLEDKELEYARTHADYDRINRAPGILEQDQDYLQQDN